MKCEPVKMTIGSLWKKVAFILPLILSEYNLKLGTTKEVN